MDKFKIILFAKNPFFLSACLLYRLPSFSISVQLLCCISNTRKLASNISVHEYQCPVWSTLISFFDFFNLVSLFLFHSLRSLFASRCHSAQRFLQEVLPAAASRAAQHSLPTSPGPGYLPHLTLSQLSRPQMWPPQTALQTWQGLYSGCPELVTLWLIVTEAQNPFLLVSVTSMSTEDTSQAVTGIPEDPESVPGQSVFISSLLHQVPTLGPCSKHTELALSLSSLPPLLPLPERRTLASYTTQDHSRNVCTMDKWGRGPGATPSSPCPI